MSKYDITKIRAWQEQNPEKVRDYKRKCKHRVKKENREMILDLKQKAKCPCGESRPYCLDFHHREGEIKKDTICNLIRHGYSKKVILTEIAKCDIICSNCHRIRHKTDSTQVGKKRKYAYLKKIDSGCIDCGMKEPCCLDFHHLDDSTKKFGIGESSRRKDITFEEMVLEIEKCVVLCSNCHKERHWGGIEDL